MPSITIAVLPFVNMSTHEDNEYFSDGMTEEIINALSRIENLKVTSRTSSFYFKNQKLPLKEIAHQLGVAFILEGSIRLAGTTVRIAAQLIQAEEDFHFWSESWDRKLENIFEIQDEISLLIADKLREQSGHLEISDHLVEKPTNSLDAYSCTLKANFLFNRWNPDDVNKAIELYEKAISIDPDYTAAYIGLADAYGFLATTEFLPREATWQKAKECINKAYELNPNNAGIHYQLANMAFFIDLDFKEAMVHNIRAITIKPNYPEAQQFMAFLYALLGTIDKANDHLEIARQVDPLSRETLFFTAYVNYRDEKFGLALEQTEDCLRHNPKNIPAYVLKSYCLLALGKLDEVLEFLGRMPDEIVVPGDRLGITCLAYILKGDKEKTDLYFSRLKEEAANPVAFQAHSYLFMAYAILHRADEAFAWIDKAIEMKSSVLLLSYAGPFTNNLKTDPRFRHYWGILYQQTSFEEEVAPKKQPLLDTATAEDYASRLFQFIEEEQPFLNPGLSLRSLADQIQIHPNQLSWLLNESIGKNFNNFINHFRVKHFKQLAVNPSNAHISLLGLAFESGFNSKTVFNTCFKKEMGLTPKEFLKSLS